jgi:hypothetical protein
MPCASSAASYAEIIYFMSSRLNKLNGHHCGPKGAPSSHHSKKGVKKARVAVVKKALKPKFFYWPKQPTDKAHPSKTAPPALEGMRASRKCARRIKTKVDYLSTCPPVVSHHRSANGALGVKSRDWAYEIYDEPIPCSCRCSRTQDSRPACWSRPRCSANQGTGTS